MDSEMETTCLTLIAASGTARSQAFEALKAAKEHNMDEARSSACFSFTRRITSCAPCSPKSS